MDTSVDFTIMAITDAVQKPFKPRASMNPKKKKRKMEKLEKHERSLGEQMENPDVPLKVRVGKARKLQQSEEVSRDALLGDLQQCGSPPVLDTHELGCSS